MNEVHFQELANCRNHSKSVYVCSVTAVLQVPISLRAWSSRPVNSLAGRTLFDICSSFPSTNLQLLPGYVLLASCDMSNPYCVSCRVVWYGDCHHRCVDPYARLSDYLSWCLHLCCRFAESEMSKEIRVALKWAWQVDSSGATTIRRAMAPVQRAPSILLKPCLYYCIYISACVMLAFVYGINSVLFKFSVSSNVHAFA